ncbi:poly(glycerol-phosphate) alpha-glucosyltransferase [Methylopila capsulata]|uniref:Poly(Glycerol-phosphate) alpha-glucosyltransferase n=1 Tax=Methylopila capsulata TaxID=61654 RepID=A0A9W6MRH2_9HYPH|nr:glycosyltransferase [Methylopila capsulata]MBM7849951.1 poly(glycerol-phosphate) alpha-glucosyltransferase [Methylopila capsulata]GLK55242.1 hypothetical protein GCM10008170_12610 [Methylopila capsulata]
MNLHIDLSTPADPIEAVARPIRVGMLVGAVGNGGGGVPASLRALCAALHRSPEVSVEVFAADRTAAVVDVEAWKPAQLSLFDVVGPTSFGFGPGLGPALIAADLDVLHVHGLWMYGSVAASRWSSRTGRPYVVSPHGMLDPWALANSRWKKAAALFAYEARHLRGAAWLHALCASEREAIRAFGLRNLVCTVANGAHAPAVESYAPCRAAARASGRRTLLYLGRLTPKKGLAILLAAWADAKHASDARAWDLVVAGSGTPAYEAGLVDLVSALGIGASVRFVGHLDGEAKAAAFARADAFVLPSVSEGQPLAVLEAWGYGLPALITSQCNLPEGFMAGAALPIDCAVDDLAAGLRALFALPDEARDAMGARGRALVETTFCWGRSARDLERIYRQAIAQAAPRRPLERRCD